MRNSDLYRKFQFHYSTLRKLFYLLPSLHLIASPSLSLFVCSLVSLKFYWILSPLSLCVSLCFSLVLSFFLYLSISISLFLVLSLYLFLYLSLSFFLSLSLLSSSTPLYIHMIYVSVSLFVSHCFSIQPCFYK